MKIHKLILVTFFLFIIAGNIHAASFDCSKASSEVEKIICCDDELSKLDESLNKAYQKALTRTDIKEQIIKRQRQWLKNERNACEDAECIKNAYETRISELSLSPHDDYSWVEPDPEQEKDLLDHERLTGFLPVDPEICKLYEENLRYFAKRNTPMSCNRPIAPHLKDRIKDVEWEDLDPDQYPDLFRAIDTSGRYSPGTSEDVIERNLKSIIAGIANKVWVFRRAKLSLVGHTHVPPSDAPPEPYWIVQYGPNDISLNNPKKSLRCEPKRGGGIRSNLQLYIVSEAKKELTKELFVTGARPSTEGQHLKLIDNRLFVENIRSQGLIELSEVDTASAWGDTVCNFVFEKSK